MLQADIDVELEQSRRGRLARQRQRADVVVTGNGKGFDGAYIMRPDTEIMADSVGPSYSINQ
jgi:hypothetical protein